MTLFKILFLIKPSDKRKCNFTVKKEGAICLIYIL